MSAYVTAADLNEERMEQAKVELANYPEGQCPEIPLVRRIVYGDPAREIVALARDREVA
ncbi:MAG: hypothetical protein WDO73_37800 [Ignavibacteriota bacterium]